MKTKTEFQTVKEAYLEQVKEQQVNEAAKTPKQIERRADTLSKNINEFEHMLQRARPKGAKDYDKAMKEFRDAYIALTDAIAKVEGMLK